MENKQIKDGLGNLFNNRMRDVGAAQDGTVMRAMHLSTMYPVDYGPGGVYAHCGKSGVIAAGMAANAPIYSFLWPSLSIYALLRRVRISALAQTAFTTAGLATFDFFIARSYSAQDTGGITPDLSGNHTKLRTTMSFTQANILYASTAALTPGTRTLDADPCDSVTLIAPATATTPFDPAGPVTLFEKLQGEFPLYLANNEGFIIQATVPAGGTWSFAVRTEWDEVQVY